MAQAVLHLFPGVKCAIGPAIKDGFYYDFDVEKPFTPRGSGTKDRSRNEKIVKQGILLSGSSCPLPRRWN